MQNEQVFQSVQMLEKSISQMESKWLTFWMDKQLFGVSIANVEQIVSMQPITEVPEYPSYSKGVINMRGSIIPLIDLRLRLGKPEMEYNYHTCIIINRVNQELLGFIVDEVEAVMNIPEESVSPPPKMGDDSVNRYLTGIARVTGDDGMETLILCLDAAKVLAPDQLQVLGSV